MQIPGSIVSCGVIGAVAARLVLGQAIDRFGVLRLWLLSSVGFVAGRLGFLLGDGISWMICAARIAFAAMFTCSIVHIQNHVPTERRTEIVGNLGSAGFPGMILGSQCGDAIVQSIPEVALQFRVLFGSAAFLGIIYIGIVLALTRGHQHDPPRRTPAIHCLVFRFWPGPVVLPALMIGANFTVSSVYLTRFATARGIGTYWTVCAVSAFVVRLTTQIWNRTIGRHRMILYGPAANAAGQALWPLVTSGFCFGIPALCCGFDHALLFPAVISLGSGAFPRRYRGTGTTIILGLFDVGALISAPILGTIIDYFENGFTCMYLATASCDLVVAAVFHPQHFGANDSDLITCGLPEESQAPETGVNDLLRR